MRSVHKKALGIFWPIIEQIGVRLSLGLNSEVSTEAAQIGVGGTSVSYQTLKCDKSLHHCQHISSQRYHHLTSDQALEISP